MDISAALLSASNIRDNLRKFPKYERLPPIKDYHSVQQLNDIHSETLGKCLHFLNKVQEEIKMYLNSFDSKYFESVQNRQKYVEIELEKARKEGLKLKHKMQLISEIEQLEQSCLQTFEKIMLDEKESMKIIDYIHGFNSEIDDKFSILENFIQLQYDKNSEARSEAYEKILNIL